jgi:hypothetical protein
VNGLYSEEIQNEDIARFEDEMLPSPANKIIPIQFWNKNQKVTRIVIYLIYE